MVSSAARPPNERAVADARGHRDDRRADQAGDERWERAVHAGDRDDHVGRADLRQVGRAAGAGRRCRRRSTRSTSSPNQAAQTAASSATGQVGGAGGDHGHADARGRAATATGQDAGPLVVASPSGWRLRISAAPSGASRVTRSRPCAAIRRSTIVRGRRLACPRRRPLRGGRCAARGGGRAWRSRGRRRAARAASRGRLAGEISPAATCARSAASRSGFTRAAPAAGRRRPAVARGVEVDGRETEGAEARLDRRPIGRPGARPRRRRPRRAPLSPSCRTRTTRKPASARMSSAGLDPAQLAEGDELAVRDARRQAGVGRPVPGPRGRARARGPARRCLVDPVLEERARRRARGPPASPGRSGPGSEALVPSQTTAIAALAPPGAPSFPSACPWQT